MRIGLDISQAAKTRGRGIARYIRQVVPPLDRSGLELTLCLRGDRWFRKALVDDLAPAAPRSWLPVPAWLTTRNIELYHSFGNHLPARASVPLTFTIHDFRALDRPAGERSGDQRLRRNIARAAGIICLTEHGKQRLQHHYPAFDEQRLAVIPHGVDTSVFRPRDPAEAEQTALRYGLRQPFVLQLGSWFEHKNLELSLQAFALSQAREAGHRLVFVGGGAPRAYREKLQQLATQLGIDGLTDWVEHIPGRDLAFLLSSAACLLQPSRYEGFALPILEAMATGTPGVVSDSSCLPEVSGGAWPIAGTDDPRAFADGMDQVTLDATSREAAIAAGLQRAATFTWQSTAQQTADFFGRIAQLGQ